MARRNNILPGAIAKDSKAEEANEIRRPITMFVEEVLTTVPDIVEHVGKVPLRNIRLEMSKLDAIKMRDLLAQQIESNVPGAVTVQCKGHLVI